MLKESDHGLRMVQGFTSIGSYTTVHKTGRTNEELKGSIIAKNETPIPYNSNNYAISPASGFTGQPE